jgi:hypothetical protein
MKLFLDSNVYLSFYFLTNDSLEELNKLADLIKKKNIELILPKQVIDEIERQRENKISESITFLKNKIIKFEIPMIGKEYEEAKELTKLSNTAQELKKTLLEKIKQDANENKLKADILIKEIIGNTNIIKRSEEILEKVKIRTDIGNPPGKKGSLGDAIIWETILKENNFNEDLYFVSKDGDFCSSLERTRIKDFLLKEFENQTEAKIYFYNDLASFLKENYPSIKVENRKDAEIDYQIGQLSTSISFAETHATIEKLTQYYEFDERQINEIVFSYITNDQINRIINDPDVRTFIERLINGKEDKINESNLRILYKYLGKVDTIDEDFPF